MSRLGGRVIATTREDSPADPLREGLRAEGAHVVTWSTIRCEPTGAPGALRGALAELESYDWVVFTSARAVEAVVARGASAPDGVSVAAVGRATADALERAGWRIAEVGDAGAAELAQRLVERGGMDGARVLFPAGSLAGSSIEDALASAAAQVHRVEAYRTLPTFPPAGRVRADLLQGVDVVTFASPSAVRSLAACLADDWPRALSGSAVAAIGPTTGAALADARIDEVVMAPEPTLAGLVEACVLATRGVSRT